MYDELSNVFAGTVWFPNTDLRDHQKVSTKLWARVLEELSAFRSCIFSLQRKLILPLINQHSHLRMPPRPNFLCVEMEYEVATGMTWRYMRSRLNIMFVNHLLKRQKLVDLAHLMWNTSGSGLDVATSAYGSFPWCHWRRLSQCSHSPRIYFEISSQRFIYLLIR